MKYISLLFLLSPFIIFLSIKYKSKLLYLVFYKDKSKTYLERYPLWIAKMDVELVDAFLIAFTGISMHFISADYYIFSYSLWRLFVRYISYSLVGLLFYLVLLLFFDFIIISDNSSFEDANDSGLTVKGKRYTN